MKQLLWTGSLLFTLCITTGITRTGILITRVSKKNWDELNTPISLNQCLTWYSQEEEIEDVYCSKCQTHLNAKKKMEVWKVPKIFVIHLKRFVEYNHHWIKSNRLVQCPIEALDPSSWMVSPPVEPLRYDLYASVNHYGRLGSGHYTAHAKKEGVWRCYDDSSVSIVDESKIISPASYVLFYKLADFDPGKRINRPKRNFIECRQFKT